jgi:transposase
MVFQWRRFMEEGASKGIENEEELVPVSELKKLEQREFDLSKGCWEEKQKRTKF